MKILAIRGDRGACGKYRITEPVRVVTALGGFDITIDEAIDVHAYENTKTKMVEVKEVQTDADILIIQRPLDNSSYAIVQQAKKQGITTIIEIDDDFHAVHRNSVAHGAVYGQENSNADWVAKTCLEADWVTVSTQALMRYAPHGRVSILRNCVPESIFDIAPRYEQTDTPKIIGWSGSVQTHPMDLISTNGRVGKVLKEMNLDFGVVGDGNAVAFQLDLDIQTNLLKTGFVELEDYYQTMADTMDIGIVPLEKSNFNQAKSHLKGLEMASLGIPFVASPTHEYTRMESYGVGKTVKSPGDWAKYIRRWVERPEEYQRDASRYREIVQNEFTYEQHATDWADTWVKAHEYARSGRD